MALRKKIVKLAQMVGGITGVINKIDENAPEYYSLECCVSDEQADVALAMGLRKPRTIEYITKKTKLPKEKAYKLAMELADIGVCRVSHNEKGVEEFFVNIYAPGILEMMVNNAALLEKYPQVGRAFEEYTRLRIAPLAPLLPPGMGMMRVIPIQSAIDGNTHAVPYEQLSYYLDKYDTFSVSDCSCRSSRRVLNQGCGHLEHDMCIHMGTGAEYYIRTGRSRQVTREEVKEILKKAEEDGLMHQMPNIEGLGESAAICNCCACSCFAMRAATMFNTPDTVRSNYVSQVDSDKCVACGQCVENCPTNALKLGQKLCTKTPLKTAKKISSRDHIWLKKNWNPDYRENRKNVVETGTSPCKTACPAHIAVQGYIKLAAQGKYKEALELIRKENPLPAVCGRICPRSCESECTRGDIDDPIAIDEIKKFIAEQDLDKKTRFIPQKKHDYGKKIAVIGSGPAGLSCAYYLAEDGYKVTVFEKLSKPGGMLTVGIPSFRLEKSVVEAEIDILKEMGVTFQTDTEVGKDVSLAELRKQGFEAFYLAIGAQGGRKLGLEGEDEKGVIPGVEFLRDVNTGKKAALNGNVIVIGGGNVAIDVARTAVREGAKTVTMYCLESRKEMPALDEEIEEALEEDIVIQNSWGPKRIISENGKVTGIEFKKCVSVFDADKKFNPKYDEKETITVKADFILLSVGQSIEWGDLLKDTKVTLNRNNTAVADSRTYQTAESDVFVGGDVYTGPKFAIDAIAAGKQAAISIHRFVHPGQSLTYGRDRREYVALDKENVVIESFDTTKRQHAGHNTENRKSFKDTRVTFTEEQLKKETERCLGCGAVQVDQYMCVGCGQCTTKCKFEAISLTKKYANFAPVYEKLPMTVAKYVVQRGGKIAASSVKRIFTGN
ncbi:FAD-dependent oxidoreductase [Treponema sp. OMZ 840]|uniref:FAD-dependent oxidoreductase n=1 Tax=Treponema sp. OMZ 840 TaxID=244313 RepID=UPI003D917CD0